MAARGSVRPTGTPVIQVFGLERDQDTRAAIRFFKERRTPLSFVDLRKRPIAPGELRRFVEHLGAEALLNTAGRTYREGGLVYLRTDETGVMARLFTDARLMRLPLVRYGNEVTAGRAESTWAVWLRPAGELRRNPSPWPTQTSPTAARPAATIQRVRIGTSPMSS